MAGVLAALSGGVWFDFFLTEPYQRFTIADPDDIEATALLVLIGLGVTEIALWGHRQQGKAARRSGYLAGVLGAARIVSEGSTPPSQLIDVVGHQISHVLGADNCRFVSGPVHDRRIALLDHDGVLTRGDHAVDVDKVGLPHDEYTDLLVRRGSRVIGHFLVTATTEPTYPSKERRQVAVLLADQVAAAIDAEQRQSRHGRNVTSIVLADEPACAASGRRAAWRCARRPKTAAACAVVALGRGSLRNRNL
ncbi:MAG TPA: DUF4118 domain-containing protein [Dermatophilaceae bacterium]|nr:DUF4118 domain-containing protein [Dermatophilaceae bacterium]